MLGLLLFFSLLYIIGRYRNDTLAPGGPFLSPKDLYEQARGPEHEERFYPEQHTSSSASKESSFEMVTIVNETV